MAYKITFRTPHADTKLHSFTTENYPHKGIADFIDGFWVDDWRNLSFGYDCFIFVMPHHIEEIRKLEG